MCVCVWNVNLEHWLAEARVQFDPEQLCEQAARKGIDHNRNGCILPEQQRSDFEHCRSILDFTRLCAASHKQTVSNIIIATDCCCCKSFVNANSSFISTQPGRERERETASTIWYWAGTHTHPHACAVRKGSRYRRMNN